MACSCKSSSTKVASVKQVVKKVKPINNTTNNKSTQQRSVARRISYRRPI